MKPSHSTEPSPWRELQRRRVVRVAFLYAAVSFAIAEVALLVLPALSAPHWAFRAVLGVLVLGFPPSIVLSWRYDVTSTGIVRTPDGAMPPEPRPPWVWRLGVAVATTLGVVIELVR